MSLLTNQSGIRPGANFWSSSVDIGQDGFEYVGGFIGQSASSTIGEPITVGTPFDFTPTKDGILVVCATADMSVVSTTIGESIIGIIKTSVGEVDTPLATSIITVPNAGAKNIFLSGGGAVVAGTTYNIIFNIIPTVPASASRGSLAVFFFE